MKIIWSDSPVTANQVINKLDGITSWNPKTIKTLLGRLVKKKAIAYERDGRSHIYFPLVTEDECVRAESRSFLEKVYDGALNVMFVNFLDQEELSKEDIEELKKILDRKKN